MTTAEKIAYEKTIDNTRRNLIKNQRAAYAELEHKKENKDTYSEEMIDGARGQLNAYTKMIDALDRV